ncbi:dolichyl-diphosphooligosaccharide--protein glycosyltransferase 48 kDa subunit-like [Schistocerca gregaria]|uniref:dolichyl-diphosphooligosaccharide--protein glycosyltransferase 48 kDa subunit-like n=1 Tax=Schistocerca gregaria TaxID=7010 RepID=UPI00211E62D9|nr:dolichyl-diphosphooligosaccharide--protein glycosyltransferase 48 kDa subunit-like [Schistocerca gregaria]
MKFLCLALFLSVLIRACSSVIDERVLVVYEDDVIDSHSEFFAQLREIGYVLSFSDVQADDIKLRYYEKYIYDQLIIFAPNAEESSLSVEAVADFANSGKGVLIAMSDSPGRFARSLAKRFRVAVRDKVVDFHLDWDLRVDQVVFAEVPSDLKSVFGENPISKVAFKGTSLSPNESLVSKLFQFPMLYSSPTSFPSPRETLGVCIQGTNDARVAIVGSLDVFCDEYSDRSNGLGNADFAREVAKWTFKGRSRLYVSSLIHYAVAEKLPRSMYSVNEEVEFRIYLREYKDDKLVPFNVDQLQLEVIKVDPVIRLNMEAGADGMHSVRFKLPDTFGYYKFRVQYRCRGYTSVFAQELLPVRPLSSEERGQIKEIAYPYYAGALSMLIGIVSMSVIILYQK